MISGAFASRGAMVMPTTSKSSTTTEGLGKMTVRREELARLDWSDISTGAPIGPVLPGDVLRLDFMEPLGLSARALARELGVPPNLVTGILNGHRAITARTAILLSSRFATTAEFWMNLQTAHDLEVARAERGLVA